MKKKIALIITISLCLIIVFSGCQSRGGSRLDNNSTTGLTVIENSKSLMYRDDTKVIYIVFNENYGGHLGYGYMSPYISENGLFCRFIDGKIVEIDN